MVFHLVHAWEVTAAGIADQSLIESLCFAVESMMLEDFRQSHVEVNGNFIFVIYGFLLLDPFCSCKHLDLMSRLLQELLTILVLLVVYRWT